MLPKKNRLILNEDEYKKLSKNGVNFYTKTLRLTVDRSISRKSTRFALLVPKKLDKRSIKRNRTRRLLSTAICGLLPRVKRGHKVLVVGNKIFYKEELKDVKPLVEEIMKQAKLLIAILLSCYMVSNIAI